MAKNNGRFDAEDVLSVEQVVEYLENESSPKKLDDCFKSDPVSDNLLAWALRIEKWAVVLICAIICLALIVLTYDLVVLFNAVNEAQSLGNGSLEQSMLSLYLQSGVNSVLQFALRVLVAIIVYYVLKFVAALMLGFARKTHCMYVETKMDEFKLRMQVQNVIWNKRNDEE
jgi:hypothetical protein